MQELCPPTTARSNKRGSLDTNGSGLPVRLRLLMSQVKKRAEEPEELKFQTCTRQKPGANI